MEEKVIKILREVFEDENPTGKICYVQIKTTESLIEELKRTPEFISCPSISESNMCYCKQERVPFVLIYNSLKKPNVF